MGVPAGGLYGHPPPPPSPVSTPMALNLSVVNPDTTPEILTPEFPDFGSAFGGRAATKWRSRCRTPWQSGKSAGSISCGRRPRPPSEGPSPQPHPFLRSTACIGLPCVGGSQSCLGAGGGGLVEPTFHWGASNLHLGFGGPRRPPPPCACTAFSTHGGWALNRRFEEIFGLLFLWSRMED